MFRKKTPLLWVNDEYQIFASPRLSMQGSVDEDEFIYFLDDPKSWKIKQKTVLKIHPKRITESEFSMILLCLCDI